MTNRPWVTVADVPETVEHKGPVTAPDDPEQHGEHTMTIHRDGDTLSVSAVTVRWEPRRRIDGLGNPNFRAIAETVVIELLWNLAISRMVAELGMEGAYHRIDEAMEDARAAVGLSRPPTPKSRIDRTFLQEVVDVWRSPAGIDGVIERYEVTERTARRWLKRAQDEGLR